MAYPYGGYGPQAYQYPPPSPYVGAYLLTPAAAAAAPPHPSLVASDCYYRNLQYGAAQIPTTGAMFNGWPGVPDRGKAGEAGDQGHAGHSGDRDGANSERAPRRNAKKRRQSTASGGLRHSNRDRDRDRDIECNNSNSDDGSSTSASTSQAASRNGRESVDYSARPELVRQVVIPFSGSGSGRVVVLVDSRPPQMTCFVVSARWMRREAGRWAQLCHHGTDACDTIVGDEAAVLAMFWMLHVMHGNGSPNHISGSSGSIAQNGPPSPPSPSPLPSTAPVLPAASAAASSAYRPAHIPTELPARVLAYVALFGHQFGAMRFVSQAPDPPSLSSTQSPILGPPPGPGTSRLRMYAETWLRAVTSRPRNRRTLDGVPSADWPYLLYTARTLGDRELFSRCLRTMLQRWHLDCHGAFCNARGERVALDLPDEMQETVSRDLTSLKSAREHSIETIVGGAVGAFH